MTAVIAALLLTVIVPGKTGTEPLKSDSAAAGEEGRGHITTVTADKLDLDSGNNIATFTKDVHVKDPDGEMWADKMVVYFDPDSREVKKLVSTGKRVIILTRGRRSESRKAVYTAADGRIVLTGDPRITHGKNTYGADRITIFKDQDRVIFEPKAHLILFSEEDEQEIEEIF